MSNRYGLDTAYFNNCIQRDLCRGLESYTPAEFARVCLRMAITASQLTLAEPEFQHASRLAATLQASTDPERNR
jgi:hypothetical protein